MQQQELAQIRQREANLTALAAIGPRKKRKMDSPVSGASSEVLNTYPSALDTFLYNEWLNLAKKGNQDSTIFSILSLSRAQGLDPPTRGAPVEGAQDSSPASA